MMGFRKILIFLFLFALTACFEAADNPRTFSDDAGLNGSGNPGDVNGDGVTNTDGSVGGDGETTIAKVEIRHLIEPKIDDQSDAGDYKRKLTIPKNYNSWLYLAGINISTLSSQSIKVRFKFGLDSLPIEIPATVSTASGMTPQTNVEVLIMDMRGKPFEDVQLLYDLYDYNDYDFTNGSEPTSYNRDDKLFCRGLALKDDPTFSGSLTDGCSASTDVCKYAYAKVVDKGLVQEADDPINDPDIPINPSEANIQSGSLGYYEDSDEIKLARCLPDNPIMSILYNGNAYTYNISNSVFTTGISFAGWNSMNPIDGKNYYYRGPYRAINTASWGISDDALTTQYGIFSGFLDFSDGASAINLDPEDYSSGYGSRLFPMHVKYNLSNGTEYLGSTDGLGLPNGAKIWSQMIANDYSAWMDGCNDRATTVHEITGEHIGSCNITATIEIVATDDDGKETIVDVTDEVKLQLVKPATLNTNGDNVLLSSFRQCSSTSQCGADECCINKHCWSKSLVNQCFEDLPEYGNYETGELCTSDYQCASLCCNKIDGRCAPHDTLAENPSYCSKPAQQSCVAKEWCAKHPVTTCAIVDTGPDPLGGRTCALRCVTAEVYGDCVSFDGVSQGVCVPPDQPDQPVFNPNDPHRCDDAITFDELVECANDPGNCNF